MKKLALVAALVAAAPAAIAGGLSPVVAEAPVMVEAAPASSMTGWLVPLIILVLIALAAQPKQ